MLSAEMDAVLSGISEKMMTSAAQLGVNVAERMRQYLCTRHFEQGFVKRHGEAAKPLLFRLARARTEDYVNGVLRDAQSVSIQCHAELEEMKVRFAQSFRLDEGISTGGINVDSNVESENHTVITARAIGPVGATREILDMTRRDHFERAEISRDVNKFQSFLVPIAIALALENMREAVTKYDLVTGAPTVLSKDRLSGVVMSSTSQTRY
jgi:hypothetical protein